MVITSLRGPAIGSTSTFPSAPYKAPNRRWYTESLFWETNLDYRSCLPVFSLNQDVVVEGPDGSRQLINCRKTFLEERDPTGYSWAMKYLGGEYAHFRALCKKIWFKDALSQWTDELDVLLRSEALRKIDEVAQGTSQSAFQAAKYLANLEHRKGSTGRGRPSNEEVHGELARAVRDAQSTEDDYQRVFGLPASAEAVMEKDVN